MSDQSNEKEDGGQNPPDPPSSEGNRPNPSNADYGANRAITEGTYSFSRGSKDKEKGDGRPNKPPLPGPKLSLNKYEAEGGEPE